MSEEITKELLIETFLDRIDELDKKEHLQEIDPLMLLAAVPISIYATYFTTSVYQNIRSLLSKCYRTCTQTSVPGTIIKMAISPAMPIIRVGSIKECMKMCRYYTLSKNLQNAKDEESKVKLQKQIDNLKIKIKK